MKKIILITLTFIMAQVAIAQDTIYKRNKAIVFGRVTEIGIDEVKYKPAGAESDPVLVIDKNDVWKIVFQNGNTILITPSHLDMDRYADNKRNAIKADFLAPMFYKTTIGYERSLKPGLSTEASLGIIGAGYNGDKNRTASGAFFKFGVKFIKSPDFYIRGMRYAHLLKGGYIKPEVFFAAFKETRREVFYAWWLPYPQEQTITRRVTNIGLHLVIGKQWVFDNKLLFDMYGGVGYCFDNLKDNEDYYEAPTMYSVIKVSYDHPFSLSGGLKVGVLFK